MKIVATHGWVGLMIFLLVFPAQKKLNAQPKSDAESRITIGLLISGNKLVEAKNGASLAIKEINEKYKTEGHIFQLNTRSMEGIWGTGSKQVVDLVFNENAWAIIGSHDGRNAHLAEQVIAKTQITYVSAWAGDPTLYRAYVPWFFSLVPNNVQQAVSLVNEICNRQKFTKVIALADEEYDSQTALKSFINEIKNQKLPEPETVIYNNSNPDFNTILNKIKEKKGEAIVLLGQPETSVKIIQFLKEKDLNVSVFGALSIEGEKTANHFQPADFENVFLISPGYLVSGEGKAFNKNYKKEYGFLPGATAAYAYDAVYLIVQAVKNSNFDKNALKQAMREIQTTGVTGKIEFDEKGNRINLTGLIKIINGIPQPVDN